MDDLINRKQAIDAFKSYAGYESNRTHAEWVRRITLVLEDLPTIDAVPVVRCDQCKWWDEDVQPDGRRRCELLDNIRFEPEFWCAYGERREE